jgi:hypothetical protein
MPTLDEMLGSFQKDDLAVRLAAGVTALVPFAPELSWVGSVDDACTRADPKEALRLAKRVRELAEEPGPASALRTADLLDKGDKGIALYSGVRGIYTAVQKQSGALETDPAQLADAGLKALGVAWIAWRLYPGEAGDRAKAFWTSPTGQALIAWYVTMDVALPFTDNVIDEGASFFVDVIGKRAEEDVGRLAAVGANTEAIGFLQGMAQRMGELSTVAAKNIEPVTRMVKERMPRVVSGADAVASVAATAVDTLSVYRYLAARMVLEECIGKAKGELDAAREIERKKEEEQLARSAVQQRDLAEGAAAASLDQSPIKTTRNTATDPARKGCGCFFALLAFVAFGGLAAFGLSGCDIAPNYVSSHDVDTAFGQGRLKTVCRGLDMTEAKTREHTAETLRKVEGNDELVQQCLCDHVKTKEGKWDEAIGKGMAGEKRDAWVACFTTAMVDPALPNRDVAIAQVAKMPAPAAKKALAELVTSAALKSEDRVAAIRTLKGFVEYQSQLLALMGDSDGAIRAAAAASLSNNKDPAVVAAMVKAYSEDTEGAVRANALQSLKAADVPEAEQMLCKAMMDDPAPEVRANAIASFKGTKKDSAVECLRKRALTEEKDIAVRTALLATLKSSPSPGAAKILCDAIPFWLRTYNKEDIPDKVPGTDIIGVQNDRDFENSYACLQKAYANSSGYSCFAKMYAGWWFRQVGGSAYVPKCPGYESEEFNGK